MNPKDQELFSKCFAQMVQSNPNEMNQTQEQQNQQITQQTQDKDFIINQIKQSNT